MQSLVFTGSRMIQCSRIVMLRDSLAKAVKLLRVTHALHVMQAERQGDQRAARQAGKARAGHS